MKHISNDVTLRILKIGNLLGLKKKDVQRLRMTAKNNEKVTINCPSHAYNNSVGYYGTVSVRDFF